MELEEELARKAPIPFRLSGGCVLIASADAERYLQACEAEGIRVLGFEGFHHEGTHIVPEMDAIADFSPDDKPYSVADSIRDSRRVLEQVGSKVDSFDFCLVKGDWPGK